MARAAESGRPDERSEWPERPKADDAVKDDETGRADGGDDHALATRLAVEAGRLLVELRADLTRRGTSSWQIMDTGAPARHRFLMRELHHARPGDAVLSEEGADDRRRLSSDRVWIVDPLDGTNEFGERGRSDWAGHVALWERGQLTAGAVSLPALELVFATHPAPVLPAV